MCDLSVVVPVYNKAKYIERCVTSIANQTLKDIKIIIVDDGSTDGSADICERLSKKEKRISFISGKHQGPIRARYSGVMMAKTEYITFVDADDWIEENAYEKLLPYMKSGYDVIKFLMTFDYQDGRLKPYENYHPAGIYNKEDIKWKILPTLVWNDEKRREGSSSSLCDKLIKKEILEKSFQQARHLNYHYCEDSTIVFPMYRWVDSLVIVEDVLYHHCKYFGEKVSYLENQHFFDDLYLWYSHLTKYMDFIPDAVKQVEKIYVQGMQPRMLGYGDQPDRVRYVFPFQKINQGSRVVLWGNGVVGKTYIQQLEKTNYCELLAILDTQYKKYESSLIQDPATIKELDFDYVVIAINNDEAIGIIRKQIIEWGIPAEKIIS